MNNLLIVILGIVAVMMTACSNSDGFSNSEASEDISIEVMDTKNNPIPKKLYTIPSPSAN